MATKTGAKRRANRRKFRAGARPKGTKPGVAKKAPGPEVTRLPAIVTVHGLELRFLRDDVEVVVGGDPDAPNAKTTRPRVNPQYRRLRKIDRLDDTQSDAAEKYAQLVELSSRGSWGSGEISELRGNGGGAYGPSDSQTEAVTEVREMNEILGPRLRFITTLFVVGDMSPTAIAELLRMDASWAVNSIIGEIAAALTRCAEHWGLGPNGRPKTRHTIRQPGDHGAHARKPRVPA